MSEEMTAGRENSSEPPGGTLPSDAGKAALISRLFRDNNQALLNFLLTHLHDQQEAREVAQEAYVKLLQLDRPDTISFLRTYLFRTAANLAIDRIRRRERTKRIERLEVFEGWAAPVEREVLAEQEVALMHQIVSELKPKYQRAFILHKFGERSVSNIAEDMKLTERMVRSYIAKALCYCRLRLDGSSVEAAWKAIMEISQ